MTEQLTTRLAAAYDGADEKLLSGIVDRLVAEAAAREGATVAELDATLKSWSEELPQRAAEFESADDALDDLEARLSRAAPGSDNALIRWVVEHPTVIASAVAAVVGAGVLRLSYVRYYDELGLSPEDVGLSPAEILIQSVLGCVAWIAGGSLYLLLVTAPLIALTAAQWATMFTGKKRPWSDLPMPTFRSVKGKEWGQIIGSMVVSGLATWWFTENLFAAVAWPLSYGLWAIIIPLPTSWRRVIGPVVTGAFAGLFIGAYVWVFVNLAAGILVAVLCGAAVTLWMRSAARTQEDEPSPQGGERRPLVTATGGDVVGAYLVFAVLTASLIVTGIPLDASRVGEDVKDGHSVDGVRVTEKLPLIGDLPVIDVRATMADLYWKPDAEPDKLPAGCLLYLGRNEGQAVFYFIPTKGRGRVVRIPAGDFVMSLRSQGSCKKPDSKPG